MQLCNHIPAKAIKAKIHDNSSVHKTNIFLLALVDKEMFKTPAFWEKKNVTGYMYNSNSNILTFSVAWLTALSFD